MFLCSRLTCDASIRSLARNGLLHPSISGSCKRHLSPSPLLQVIAAIVSQGGTQSAAENRQVIIWEEFTFSLYGFLLQYLLGWQVHGPLHFPEGLCFYLFAWLSVRDKRNSPLKKVSCVILLVWLLSSVI